MQGELKIDLEKVKEKKKKNEELAKAEYERIKGQMVQPTKPTVEVLSYEQNAGENQVYIEDYYSDGEDAQEEEDPNCPKETKVLESCEIDELDFDYSQTQLDDFLRT